MIQIKFTASGANSVIGCFARGDIARLSDTFARHLVEEARVAEYVVPAAVNPQKPPKTTRRKTKE